MSGCQGLGGGRGPGPAGGTRHAEDRGGGLLQLVPAPVADALGQAEPALHPSVQGQELRGHRTPQAWAADLSHGASWGPRT